MFDRIDSAGEPDEGWYDDMPDPAVEVAAVQAVDAVEQTHARSEVDEMDADQTLVEAAASRRAVTAGEVRQLVAAAHWADLHDVVACPSRAPGSEMMVQPGGDGTPELAEFAAAELGAILGVTSISAMHLIGDALDFRHRLPLLWAQVLDGNVKVWVARKIAQRSRRLSTAAAAKVDRKVARVAASLPFGRLVKVLDAAMLAADPPQAVSDAQAAAAQQGVWIGQAFNHGHGTLFARAAAPDLMAFDKSLDVVSRAMKILGDSDAPDVRRARALGVLASPQAALDLVASAEAARKASASAAAARRAARTGPPLSDQELAREADLDRAQDADHDPARDRRRCGFGRSTLYVHLSQQDLAAVASGACDGEAGVARVEDIGPAILDQVAGWLESRNVRLQPVIDLPGMPALDCYEIPTRMAEAVGLEKPADCFPYSPNLSRNQDGEHTVPYVPMDEGGPPGQTARSKLARTGRRNHRAKTHGRWKVTQPRSGVWIWRAPHGHYFLVDGTGTTALGKL